MTTTNQQRPARGLMALKQVPELAGADPASGRPGPLPIYPPGGG